MRHTHKALLVVLALLLVLPLAGASAAPSTAGVPGGPFSTGFRIQNATATGQTVSVDYFAPGATTPTVHTTVALAGNGAATVDQSAVSGLLPNVSYSAKITGSSPLAATVSIFGNTGSAVANQ